MSVFFAFRNYTCSTFDCGICALVFNWEIYFVLNIAKENMSYTVMHFIYKVFCLVCCLMMIYEDSGCAPNS